VAPALAAGCTIIVKPAELTPLTALAAAELALQAGIPPGVLNIVIGDAVAIGAAMMASTEVRKITFTGSTGVGKKLMAGAAGTVKKISLELGGNAPCIIFDDANLEVAVKGTLAGKYRNTGQTCVCINRVLVQDGKYKKDHAAASLVICFQEIVEVRALLTCNLRRMYIHRHLLYLYCDDGLENTGIYEKFANAFVKAVSQLQVGNGLENGVTQGPLINEAALQKVENHVQDAVSKGAKVLTGGKRHSLGRTFYEPTVLSHATEDMLIFREEVFGPVAPLVRFKTEEEAIKLANDTEFGTHTF
jgi:succinate-semialdehyde dehydrogenase